MFHRIFIKIIIPIVLLPAFVSAYDYEQDIYGHTVKWRTSDMPIVYRIDDTGTPDCANEFTAIQNSFQAWEDACAIDFNYGGTGSYAPTDWNTDDSANINVWCESSWTTVTGTGTGTIAANATAYAYSPSICYIVYSDVAYNGEYFTWSDSGEAGKMDVQNIATHEMGHSLILNDLYGGGDTEKTMYGYGSSGETKKRTLDTDDINGAQFLYPYPSGLKDWTLY